CRLHDARCRKQDLLMPLASRFLSLEQRNVPNVGQGTHRLAGCMMQDAGSKIYSCLLLHASCLLNRGMSPT
ncbi:MAG: hypothetical protein AB1420_09690, partial [Bacillota bacterium]